MRLSLFCSGLNSVSQNFRSTQNLGRSFYLERKVFVNAISSNEVILKQGIATRNPITIVLTRKGATCRETQEEEAHVITEADIGVI